MKVHFPATNIRLVFSWCFRHGQGPTCLRWPNRLANIDMDGVNPRLQVLQVCFMTMSTTRQSVMGRNRSHGFVEGHGQIRPTEMLTENLGRWNCFYGCQHYPVVR